MTTLRRAFRCVGGLVALMGVCQGISRANGLCCSSKGYVACVEQAVSTDSLSAYGDATVRIFRVRGGGILIGSPKTLPLGGASLAGVRCTPNRAEFVSSDRRYFIDLSSPPPFRVRSDPSHYQSLPAESFVDAQHIYTCGDYTKPLDEAIEADDSHFHYQLTTHVEGKRGVTQLDQQDPDGRVVRSVPLLQWRIAPCLGDEAQ